ncbi:MAG: hypothetical protein AAGC74_04045 [Verrucomicrobiota bacterium]
MSDLREMESKLEGLLPRGMGEHSAKRLGSVIEGLAEGQVEEESGSQGLAWVALLLIAAVAMGFVFVGKGEESLKVAVVDEEPEFELLEQAVWLAEGRAQGLQVDGEGEARRKWSFVTVEEETMRHLESGEMVILQSEVEGELNLVTSL